MVSELPRLVVAAAASGQGKTTVTMGLMAALTARGLRVSPGKVGPDYIDPGFHALATGRPGRNLDPHLCGEALVAPLLLHAAQCPEPADLAIVEGVMGLFDGRLGSALTTPDGAPRLAAAGSTAHVAGLIDAPVLLVLDAAATSRTAVAVAQGLAAADPSLRIGGVILTRCSPNVAREMRGPCERAGIPLLGAIPRSPGLAVPSRHLGLIPAGERDEARDAVRAAAELVGAEVDLDAVLALARSAPPLAAEPWSPESVVSPVTGRPVVAMAGGRAFTFRYPETAELLAAAGCEVAEFDPLRDDHLPAGTSALWLGGGFPEMHATELASRASLRAEIAAAVAAGMPTYAECAGMLYLAGHLDDTPMSGALPLTAAMAPRLTLGYHEVIAVGSVFLDAGAVVAAHEFHRTATTGSGLAPAWTLPDGRPEGVVADPAGTGVPTVLASYQHVHWAAYPSLAERMARAAASFDAWTPPAGRLPTPVGGGAPDLRHHGDRDKVPGLVNLSVNVHGTRPAARVLDAVLADPARWASYPDAAEARRAIATRHGVPEEMVLPTSGGAEAFTLVAALRPRDALVVHPQFTEPEQALRAAGVPVRRHVLVAADGFRLTPGRVQTDAELVVVGNPTNPTGVLHPAADLRALAGPGRILLVDEAFLDVTAPEESLIGPSMPGTLVVRSITKTWAVPGLRAGYVVGDPALIARLAEHQPPWSVSAPALDALIATATPDAVAETAAVAATIAAHRDVLVTELTRAGCPPAGEAAAPFVLVDTGDAGARDALAALGFAVRRGESFPGLGPQWIRLAVREPEISRAVADALAHLRSERTTP